MLIRLTVENFKSFDGETELPMVSSTKIRKHSDHVLQSGGVKILKHAAIYGANASGKSNLISCFRFIQQTLANDLSLKSTGYYCRNSKENRHRKSIFELQFSIGELYYAYGFSAVLSERRIVEEWLYDIGSNPETPLLERSTSEERISTGITLDDRSRTRFDTYAEDYAANTTGLFLSELNRSKRFEEDSPLSVYKVVFDWLMHQVAVVDPMQPLMSRKYHEYLFDDGTRAATAQMLGSFDTGISGIELKELSVDELADMVPLPVLKKILDDVEKQIAKEGATELGVTIRGDKDLAVIRFWPNGDMEATAVRLQHTAPGSLFEFGEESDGTRRLFDLIDLLLTADDDAVYVVDELERSLHPMLVRQFLRFFMARNASHTSQLIFSTHEASIMSQDLFRRDEIWFVDRDASGNSRIYSLDRFKERFDKDISKAYLEGRYGAVPVFSDLQFAKRGDTDATNS